MSENETITDTEIEDNDTVTGVEITDEDELDDETIKDIVEEGDGAKVGDTFEDLAESE